MNTYTYSLINHNHLQLKKQFILLFILLLGSKLAAWSQDLFDSTHTRQYANFLRLTHQYKQASDEYNRLYFFSNQQASYLPSLFYTLRKCDQEQNVLQRFTNPNDLNDAAFQQYVYCLVKTNKTKEAIQLVNARQNLDTNLRNSLLGMSYIDQYRWKDASLLYSRIPFPEKEKVQSILQQTAKSHYKSPVLAASLSAVVPGLGKLYTGNKKDALMSFIFVGVNAFQTYRYFHKKGIQSKGGWIFASLSTGFYLGNVYGSYKAAKHKNKKINDAYKKQIFELTDMD